MKRLFTEITSHPSSPAPQLFCPECQLPLVYRYTVYGGVDQRERWDNLACRTHGLFEFRQRTRKLRPDNPRADPITARPSARKVPTLWGD